MKVQRACRRGRPWMLAGMAIVVFALAGTNHSSATEVTVQLSSGRVFRGAVDARTDADRLWLRFSMESGFLIRPIDWRRVVSATQGDRPLTHDELRQIADQLKDAATLDSEHTIGIERSNSGGVPVEPLPVPNGQAEPPPPSPQPRVRSLKIDAAVANWDDDVEVDGLLVNVYPLDDYLWPLPVDGTLDVELFRRVTQELGNPPNQGLHAFPALERWSRRVLLEDFGPFGAVYKLEFHPAYHPDFGRGFDSARLGLLHARLNAPGHGTFDATATDVEIRPYSAFRDAVQTETTSVRGGHYRRGSRFLPVERTGPHFSGR